MEMEAGFAARDITPAVGKVIPGLFGPRIATGVLDPLQATACVIRERESMVAIIVVDAVSFSCATANRIRAAIHSAIGIRRENTIVAASHTYCGGPTNDVLGSDSDPSVSQSMRNDNYRGLKTAGCAQTVGHHEGWAFNRRFRMCDGS